MSKTSGGPGQRKNEVLDRATTNGDPEEHERRSRGGKRSAEVLDRDKTSGGPGQGEDQ
jgi:hypothetical protein